jgi:hypothetical protein
MDMTTELPSPPRDPYPTSPEDAFQSPETSPEATEEAEAPVVTTHRLGVTAARVIDERAEVMLKRFDSYEKVLAGVGVTSTGTYVGMKLELQESLHLFEAARDLIEQAREKTSYVRETIESL